MNKKQLKQIKATIQEEVDSSGEKLNLYIQTKNFFDEKMRSLVEEGSNPNIEFERAQQIESEMNVLIRRMELETEGLKKFRHNVETLGRKVKTYKLLEKKHPKK